MKNTEKYLIHATIAADGVVERSDVVGAVFGQTEGLLGDELDLRDLQESSRVGRIDVSVESENGQSFGEVTVASSLDKVETAILGAALETIDRIGPCHASVEVTSIEDVRAAKRREVVERAKELIAGGFEETSLASDDILDEVREAARVEGIVDYEGLPAGPRVGDSDAVIVVEGRADVLTLLDCGIKNAVAVEGTNIPDAVAELTASRTVTAFLDGDRGGELILRELAQVGDVDYVAFAPPGKSVEDLDRSAVFEALRGKIPYSSLADEPNLREAAGEETGHNPVENAAAPERGRDDADGPAVGGPDSGRDAESDGQDGAETERRAGGQQENGAAEEETDGVVAGAARGAAEGGLVEAVEDAPAPAAIDSENVTVDEGRDEAGDEAPGAPATETDAATTDQPADPEGTGTDAATTDTADAEESPDESPDESAEESPDESPDESAEESPDEPADDSPADDEPRSIEEHGQEVVDAESARARLLAEDLGVLAEVDATDAFDAVESAETAPHTVVIDGQIDQRLLDVAAQRGVSELLGREVGTFVKRPVGTRVLTVGDLRAGS